jgi:hypothetical protein
VVVSAGDLSEGVAAVLEVRVDLGEVVDSAVPAAVFLPRALSSATAGVAHSRSTAKPLSRCRIQP